MKNPLVFLVGPLSVAVVLEISLRGVSFLHASAMDLVGWEKKVQAMLDFLAFDHPHVYPSGRRGLFLHYNMDHASMMGRAVAAGLLRGTLSKGWYARWPEWQQMKVRI